MRLAEYTDYTLRVLMHCAAQPQQRVTIGELAQRHAVSKNHLMKIVNDLARQGVVETTRGRGGGLRLLKDPASIRVGDIVRASETDFRLVECFDPRTDGCTLTPACRLRKLLDAALQAYFRELDGATLADIAIAAPAVDAARATSRTPRGGVVPISGPARRRTPPAATRPGGR